MPVIYQQTKSNSSVVHMRGICGQQRNKWIFKKLFHDILIRHNCRQIFHMAPWWGMMATINFLHYHQNWISKNEQSSTAMSMCYVFCNWNSSLSMFHKLMFCNDDARKRYVNARVVSCLLASTFFIVRLLVKLFRSHLAGIFWTLPDHIWPENIKCDLISREL